jgi:hypothetical protein
MNNFSLNLQNQRNDFLQTFVSAFPQLSDTSAEPTLFVSNFPNFNQKFKLPRKVLIRYMQIETV